MSLLEPEPADLSLSSLKTRYPLLARDVGKRTSLSPFNADGVACEPGWASLVIPVLDQIEADITARQSAGVPTHLLPQVEQVKQKFGELHIYVNYSTPAINAAIAQATVQSRRTCAICGNAGSRRIVGGWQLASVCDEHGAEKRFPR